MSTGSKRVLTVLFGAIALVAATSSNAPATPGGSGAVPPPSASPQTVAWFQATEQSLMDSVGAGDRTAWDRVMDATCVVTSEEGEVIDKRKFLEDLRPLPPGLSGHIAVRDLTVEEYPGFALVRYRADEWETVFGQKLNTQYRVTDTFRRDAKSKDESDGQAWKMVGSHFSVVTTNPPPQVVAKTAWPSFAGTYQLLPGGWTFTVELRDGKLFGGRDPRKLKPFIPLAPNAFVLSDSLGEWIFVSGVDGKVTHILDFRKFEPLVWTRIEPKTAISRQP